MKRVLFVLMAVLTLVGTGCKKKDPLGKHGDKLVKESIVIVDGEEVKYKTGDLASVIEGKTVETLVWKTGSIGASDIAAMKNHCQSTLKHLDMERVNFATASGEYKTYDGYARITNALTVPVEMCKSFTALESVVLPAVATTIDKFAFASCSSLKEVTFGNRLSTLAAYAFMGSAMEHIELPESLLSIGPEAFYCVPLKELTIPAGVSNFFDDTFIFYREASKLEKVTCKGSTPPAINHGTTLNQCENVFNLTPAGFKIYVPRKAVDKYKAADRWSAHADQIVGF